MMKGLSVVLLIVLLIFSTMTVQGIGRNSVSDLQPVHLQGTSLRCFSANAVVIPDSDPFFGVLGTIASCWYDKESNVSGLLPLLIQQNGTLTNAQQRFLMSYFTIPDSSILVLGHHLDTTYPTQEIIGAPPVVSLNLASQLFTSASTILILPYETNDAYRLSLLAAPLASYLNIPILFYDSNEAAIQTICTQLQTTHAYLVGNVTLHLTNVTVIPLVTAEDITDTILTVINDEFGAINYLAMTNPADVISPNITNTTHLTLSDHIENKKIIILSKKIDLSGNDTRTYSIPVPDGINRIQISGELFQKQVRLFERRSSIVPLLFMTLTDAHGHVVAYTNSMSYDIGKTYLETLTCNASGTYTLKVTAYYGIKGGYFLERGLSLVNADIMINTTISTLATPHLPAIPKLSMIASYLAAAHGGIVLANSSWELTDSSYAVVAQGSGAGPWYNESLHSFTNKKVNTTVQELNNTLQLLGDHDLLSGYRAGPAWLAILADTTMIPMYYYAPSDEDIPDRGLPSDNLYSLNQTLSTGRLIGWNAQDVSTLVARTFFYETICGKPSNLTDWHSRFNFVFGQGFGETGGVFHQIPYAKEIRAYGFSSKVYGDLRDSRQMTSLLHVYTGANYIEYLGHGDWFWIPASWYGFDVYSKAVDVAHAKDWVYDRPNIFLTSACLLGRVDGLPPQENIGLAMLHAGCNGFVGATRETGSESGLTVLENHLIVDDWSIGAALRGEKQVDQEQPTFYVRTLYGDPAFNPFEPQHGFSSQGRPMFAVTTT
jgi:hypothetical protein